MSEYLASLFDVTSKNAVVTGGAKGVGAMIAEALCKAGANVLIVARDGTAAQDIISANAAEAGSIGFVEADLATAEGVRNAAAQIGERFDALHILVNNAGTFAASAIEDADEMAWDSLMELNLRAPFFLTKHLLPHLRAGSSTDNPARVILMGSIGALWGRSSGGAYSYAAGKAGIHQLARMLASDLTAQGINVNAIAPGFFPSDMTDGLSVVRTFGTG